MKHTVRSGLAAFCLLAAALCPQSARAQSNLEIMASFPTPVPAPAGRLLAAADGSLFGTTPTGGLYGLGSIFALRPDGLGGFTFEELFSFSGAEGQPPTKGMSAGSDGRFYGTNGEVGPLSFFRLDLAGHLTQLARIPSGGPTNASPLTLASDGNFYGTTASGGTHNDGIIFRFELSGNVTTLHDLGGTNEGAFSSGGLVQGGDGRLYGTTRAGGAADNPGTIFAIETAGNFTTPHVFSGTDGVHPVAGLTLASDGNFYGTTSAGGASNYGTVFKFTQAGTLTVLHTFAGTTDGASPVVNLVQAPDGNLYGTTPTVPLQKGEIAPTLFRVDLSGNFTTVPTTAAVPGGPLTLGADGNLYAANGAGVFRIHTSGTIETVYAAPFFSIAPVLPYGGLIEFPDGSLYGLCHSTTISAAIFSRSPSGQVSTFHIFFAALVNPGLLHLDDGSFYGTAALTNTNQNGNVFRVDSGGIETSLHEFSGPDGFLPRAGLTVGPSGELWGTTQRGGTTDNGTVFKLDAMGTFSSLNSFGVATDPDYFPASPLIHSQDGNFYGLGNSTFFRVDGLGAITPLRDFFASDNSLPQSLLLASDGNFYSTLTSTLASIVRLDATGSLTPLSTFADASVRNNLTEASDASLYGIAPGNPFASFPFDYGSVFRMDSAANVTTVIAFDGSFEGVAYPSGPLLEASDGNFYGAAGGGFAKNGALYRLLSATPPPSITALEPAFGSAAGGAAVTIRGSHFRQFPGASFGGVAPALGTFLFDQATLTTLAPALAPGTLNDVVITNGDTTSVTLPAAWFADFLDVPGDHIFHDYIEKVFRNGITAGCGAGNYCPSAPVTRAQMAVFLLKAEHGSGYAPPACTGHFGDVPCPSTFADWIEQLAAENITAGCGDGTNYCPGAAVIRQQMAVFLLKTEHGSDYVPPACAQVFDDVPCPSPFADWIERLAAENITGGCGGNNYCPSSPNTRGQMATFLSKTFSLP